MLNEFFQGTVDDLLNRVSSVPDAQIEKLNDPDAILNRKEMIDTITDDLKISKEEAERIVTQIQLEELDRICQGMVEKGFLEISSYDEDGQPVYTPTELGRKAIGQ